MHCAAQNGHANAIKALVEVGANPSATDRFGFTSMDIAVKRRHTNVIKALREIGVDVSESKEHGKSKLTIRN
jgi:ankyrin repeat protein